MVVEFTTTFAIGAITIKVVE